MLKQIYLFAYWLVALLVGSLLASADEQKWVFGNGLEVTLTDGQSFGNDLSHDEALQQLIRASDMVGANLKKIATWKGAYLFRDALRFDGEIPLVNSSSIRQMETAEYLELDESLPIVTSSAGPGYWEITRGTASFELDWQNNLYHIFYSPSEPVAFLNTTAGRGYSWPTVGDPVHWTVTPDSSLEFYSAHNQGPLQEYPIVESVPPTGGRIAYKRSPDAPAKLVRFIDPRSFFSIQSTLITEALGFYMDRLKSQISGSTEPSPIAVQFNEKMSPLMVIVMHSKNGYGSVIILDADKGFAPVGFRQLDDHGVILEERTVEFLHEAGVFLPKACRWTKSQSNGMPVFNRQFELQHSSLNAVIPAANFTVAMFGVKYGERIVDELHNRLDVFVDAERVVDAELFQFDPTLVESYSPPLQGRGRWLPWINMGLFLLILMFGVWWRKRNAGQYKASK